MIKSICFINCSITVKHIGTAQEHELREWCHQKKLDTGPLVTKGNPKSKSPKNNILKGGKITTSVRYCKTCKKYTVFHHKSGWKHSKCLECNQTLSSRGDLTTKINKCLHPKRYRK